MNIKKILSVAAVALVIYLIVVDPQGAADSVRTVLSWLQGAAQSLIAFIRNVFDW